MRSYAGVLLSLAACALRAQDLPNGTLLVLSKGEHMLVMVNPASGKVLARMPSGPDPHEVIASADGKFAYISNYGGGSFNTLTPVDLVNHKTLPVIDLGGLRGPHGLVFEGGKLWFTAEGSKAIARFDPATQKVDWVMGTGQDRTHMLYVTADLKKIYTSNISSATMTLMEQRAMKGPPGPPPGMPRPAGAPPGGGPAGGPPRMDWEETVVPVGPGAEGFDVSPDGTELWAANAGDGTVSVLDLHSQKVVETIAADASGANRLKFTTDGKLVLVSSLRGSDLIVLEAASRKVVKRVPIGHGAAGIQISGPVAFVACTPDDYVAVVDLKSLAVLRHVDAGREPDGMAWQPAR